MARSNQLVTLEVTDSTKEIGQLYPARRMVATVDTGSGIVSWSEGVNVLVFDINGNLLDADTLHHARKARTRGLINGKATYMVDYCCSTRDDDDQFSLIWGNGYEITCPGIMNWRGLAVNGPINTDPRAVMKRYRMTLPSFEPYEITAADWVSNPLSEVLYPACDSEICSLLSGRQVILQAEFDGTNATFLSPGTCAYSAVETHNLVPSYTYLLPNGNPLEVLWQLNLSFRFSWKAIEYFYNSEGVMDRPPVKRLSASVSCINWWGQSCLGAARVFDTDDFFFDTPITLGGTMNPSSPIPSSTTSYSILLAPRKPKDIFEDPAFPSGNAVRFAGIKVTGNFTLDPA